MRIQKYAPPGFQRTMIPLQADGSKTGARTHNTHSSLQEAGKQGRRPMTEYRLHRRPEDLRMTIEVDWCSTRWGYNISMKLIQPVRQEVIMGSLWVSGFSDRWVSADSSRSRARAGLSPPSFCHPGVCARRHFPSDTSEHGRNGTRAASPIADAA